ncbi:hypothetical protein BofuT4_uP120420.1 [Botrytis cinerea T4]|uniref:Uncharacterized protein n=1 Tax=Botryotinia fuckeliana (strain T4) TaxID=999810 RepID=G2XXZ9_BOTF4|nr:hypothetical protein BofuT4_uP120420.1 [Botrytis cinerea T4]
MTVSVLTSKEHKSREAYFPPLILFVFFLPCMDSKLNQRATLH